MKDKKNKIKRKKIILGGGGTGGSVTPLLAVYEKLKDDFDFLFVGTYKGVEVGLVKKRGLRYKPIISGKWRRYFSFLNFIDIFKIFFAFWQSLFLLLKEKPNLIISAGGFVAVPLSIAGWFLKIPIIIHQQDIAPGLANKIMAKFAKVITVTFEKSLHDYGRRAKWIGNLGPEVSAINLDSNSILLNNKDFFSLNFPLVLIMGGGTGSQFINKLVAEAIKDLSVFSKVIHISGKNDRDNRGLDVSKHDNYIKLEFVDHQDLLGLISVADLVVSRCGLGALTELSFLKKPTILIPMPNSHQEENANEFSRLKSAKVLSENILRADIFINEVKNILDNRSAREELSLNISGVIKNGNGKIVEIIRKILN